MKGSVNISDYFYGAKTQFIIPLYQRKYAWQKKHCVRLFEDLIKIHKEELQSHFSEVLLQQSQRGWRRFADYRWSAAYHNFIAPDSGRFQCSCQWRYATWQWRYWGSKEKLSLCHKKKNWQTDKTAPDWRRYRSIWCTVYQQFRWFHQEYRHYCKLRTFYQLIQISNLTFEELIKAIEKLEVIDIRLEAKDNPQLILNL